MLVSVKIELMKVVNIGNVPITKYIQMNVILLILLCEIARFCLIIYRFTKLFVFTLQAIFSGM